MKLIYLKFCSMRFALMGAILTFTYSCVKGAEKSQLPPANVFNMAEMRAPSTLDLKILSDENLPASRDSTESIRAFI